MFNKPIAVIICVPNIDFAHFLAMSCILISLSNIWHMTRLVFIIPKFIITAGLNKYGLSGPQLSPN